MFTTNRGALLWTTHQLTQPHRRNWRPQHFAGWLRICASVQNIDMMNLAGFCRNCLSRWYREAAEAKGVALTDPAAREIVYGMPYKEWQAKFQKAASPAQQAAFAESPKH